MSKRIFSTNSSFLDVRKYENSSLVDQCVDDVKNILSHEPPIYIAGKECRQHRDIGFFSNESIGYKYSGQLAKSQKLTQNLEKLMNEINELYQSSFNAILVNYYKDGTKTIGKHSDDEKYLDKSGVVCLSYGASRKFRIRNKQTKEIVYDLLTENNQIIHMGGNFQKEFTHEIPQELNVTEGRYSFTFRKHLM